MAELSTIARPYAEALFEAVQDDAQGQGLDVWSDALARLTQVAALPSVQAAMGDPRLTDAQRTELLVGLVPQGLPERLQQLVAAAVENDRVQALPQIAELFEERRNALEGTALARITTAFALDDTQLAELLRGLEHKFGLKLKPEVVVDPALIGGVRVTVGDHVLDTSVQAQLAALRTSLVA